MKPLFTILLCLTILLTACTNPPLTRQTLKQISGSADEDGLGDIPLDEETYQKHLKPTPKNEEEPQDQPEEVYYPVVKVVDGDTYQPVNNLRNKKQRNEAVLKDLPELIQEPLTAADLNVIYNGSVIPFPSSAQQSNFYKNNKRVLRKSVNPNRITETDLFGTFHLRVPDGGRFAGYYSSLNAIRSLLDSGEWKENVTGYYLNVTGDFDAVRLSYWTTSPEQTRQVVDAFVAERGLEYIQDPSIPVRERISEEYGGEEFRFRKFLATYTQIGLDLLDYDITYARRLVAEYRLSYSPQRLSCRPLFEPALTKHSPYYNNLDSHSKTQLWRDFHYWHPGGDWLHMMVNMLLPGDWLYIPNFKPLFLGDHRPPITPDLRQAMLAIFNLDIPRGWRP